MTLVLQATGRTYLLLVEARNELRLQLPSDAEKAVDELVASIPRVRLRQPELALACGSCGHTDSHHPSIRPLAVCNPLMSSSAGSSR